MTEYDLLRDKLAKEYASVKSWQKISERYPPKISRAHIRKIVLQGWEPLRADIRVALGLPALQPVPVCPVHLVAHCYDCETQVVKPAPKPRKKRRLRRDVEVWIF